MCVCVCVWVWEWERLQERERCQCYLQDGYGALKGMSLISPDTVQLCPAPLPHPIHFHYIHSLSLSLSLSLSISLSLTHTLSNNMHTWNIYSIKDASSNERALVGRARRADAQSDCPYTCYLHVMMGRKQEVNFMSIGWCLSDFLCPVGGAMDKTLFWCTDIFRVTPFIFLRDLV